MDKPLRILAVLNVPWDLRLGAPRVWFELLEQWKAAGHHVDKFSLSDAFPNATSARAMFALRQVRFAGKAAAFVRRNADRFDIIDSLLGTLPFTKQQLRFSGLVVGRSVGLYRLYADFDRQADERWPERRKGKIPGRILYRFTKHSSLRASEMSVRCADLINLPNEEELRCLRQDIGSDKPAIVQPYGLTADRQRALKDAAAAPEIRLPARRISFVGMWSRRKGANDWPAIVRGIRQRIPDASFRFLGTMVDRESVLRDLGADRERIEVVSDYEPDELPRLLSDCTVGAFPSYVEGFGLAVLEQLAAGLPTVAYDVAGPRDLLRARFPQSLVGAGDISAFVDAICRIIEQDLASYRTLALRSTEAAGQFRWSTIADQTLSAYRSALEASAPA
jgi:glycosyltransferase involved in cell wall biosynthesis